MPPRSVFSLCWVRTRNQPVTYSAERLAIKRVLYGSRAGLIECPDFRPVYRLLESSSKWNTMSFSKRSGRFKAVTDLGKLVHEMGGKKFQRELYKCTKRRIFQFSAY